LAVGGWLVVGGVMLLEWVVAEYGALRCRVRVNHWHGPLVLPPTTTV
jgi:hypothetical protein